jgi:hypothetical protein
LHDICLFRCRANRFFQKIWSPFLRPLERSWQVVELVRAKVAQLLDDGGEIPLYAFAQDFAVILVLAPFQLVE